MSYLTKTERDILHALTAGVGTDQAVARRITKILDEAERERRGLERGTRKVCSETPTLRMTEAAVSLQRKGPALWADLWRVMWEAAPGEPIGGER